MLLKGLKRVGDPRPLEPFGTHLLETLQVENSLFLFSKENLFFCKRGL